MFIIGGLRGRWSVRRHDGGEFFCPTCGGDRPFSIAVLRRWASIFFIPLFPIGKAAAEAVQCSTCGSRFERRVLDQPTSAVLSAELQGSMRLAVTAVVRSTGGGPNHAAVEAVRNLGLEAYDAGSLAHDVQRLELTSLDDHLAYLAGTMSLHGREQFVGTLGGVARSSTDPAAARPTLERVGRGLGLSAAHIAGVLAAPASRLPLPATPHDAGWEVPPPDTGGGAG